jgi:poly-gamma-glutamate capsule biosynthesis protein CapA/YwtB (metallophosphatase superfamily)
MNPFALAILHGKKPIISTFIVLILATISCSAKQTQTTASDAQPKTIEAFPSVANTPLASPTNVQTTAIPEATPSPSTHPTLIPTPTEVPMIAVFVPSRWHEAAKSAISSLDTKIDWQFVNEPDDAGIVLTEGIGPIPVLERSIALIVPFSSPILEITGQKAEQYLMGTSGEIGAVDWQEIPTGYRALRVDGLLPVDKAYPLKQLWSFNSSFDLDEHARQLGSALSERLENPNMVHLVAVGDIMLDRSLGYMIESGDLDYPFINVADTLRNGDITLGNFESSLGDTGEAVTKSYNFQSPPESAQSLSGAGFDIVSLANNHALDFGRQAMIQAIDLLTANDIATVGAGVDSTSARSPVVIDRNGVTLAFLGYVDVPVEGSGFDTRSWEAGEGKAGLAWASPDIIAEDVTSAREMADVVVVILHSGYEFQEQPSPPQIASAEAAIDAGAELVISHHSHLLQGIDFYKDGVIVYGLGNFAFDMDSTSFPLRLAGEVNRTTHLQATRDGFVKRYTG